jgi:hypothetical protein
MTQVRGSGEHRDLIGKALHVHGLHISIMHLIPGIKTGKNFSGVWEETR